jgi:hypothetical protein
MIGQTVRSTSAFPVGTIVFILIAVIFAVIAVASSTIDWAVAAVWPLVAALLWWWFAREPAFAAEFTEDAIEVAEPAADTIPYTEIQGLRVRGRSPNPEKKGPESYPIQVAHSDGVLQIPAYLDVPSDKVFRFLFDQITPFGSREVNPVLEDYALRQEKTYGEEKVWTYCARQHLGSRSGHRRAWTLLLSFVLAGAAWLAFGILRQEPGWMAAGFVGMIAGGFFYFILWLDSKANRGSVKNWRQASLVISPEGLALIQGDLKGEMRWDELKDVKFRTKPRFYAFEIGQLPLGLALVVEGTTLVIADVYDRPLAIIYERILEYWKQD